MCRLAARLAKLSSEASTQLAQIKGPRDGPISATSGVNDLGVKKGSTGIVSINTYAGAKKS